MKRVLIAAGAVLGAFALALAGAYLAMPPAPADAMARPDSLAAADTAAALPAMASVAGPDTASVGGAPAETPFASKALKDSLQAARQRLGQVEEETEALREEASALREQLAALKDGRMKAGELSSALVKMEKRELNELLKAVDMSVLRQLYEESSGRARTRLLQSMSPARAARFVNQMVDASTSKRSLRRSSSSASSSPSAEASLAATPSSK